MKMKKILAIFLAAIMLFSLAACDLGSTEDPNKDNPGASQTEDQGGEGTSGTDEPENTDNNSTENNEVDTWTVENFLKLYGFDAEDLKPNHFTSFEELEIVGSTEPGKRNSKGIVKINAEKGKTTADDYNAWFENLYAKMTELSDDGKLWYTGGKVMEAPTLEELKAES